MINWKKKAIKVIKEKTDYTGKKVTYELSAIYEGEEGKFDLFGGQWTKHYPSRLAKKIAKATAKGGLGVDKIGTNRVDAVMASHCQSLENG